MIDTSKTVNALVINGVQMQLAGGGGGGASPYQIIAAEQTGYRLVLLQDGNIISEQTISDNWAGKVVFDVQGEGQYEIQAFDTGNAYAWNAFVTVHGQGQFICKSGKGLGSYTPIEKHAILQGGVFSIMFSAGDTFTMQDGPLAGNTFFVEDIKKYPMNPTAETVDFRQGSNTDYGTSLYNIQYSEQSGVYFNYAYLDSGEAQDWIRSLSTVGGYQFSDLRRKMMSTGSETYTLASGLKPADTSLPAANLPEGITIGEMFYTTSMDEFNNAGGMGTSVDLYTFSWGEGGLVPFSDYANLFGQTIFAAGYFQSLGYIDESIYNTYFCLYYLLNGIWTKATNWVEGTEYFGFYRNLQQDGAYLSYFRNSSYSEFLTTFEDMSAAIDPTNNSALVMTNDYVNIPAFEEVTGANSATSFFDNETGFNLGMYNMSGEGTHKPAYNTLRNQLIANQRYWTRSACLDSPTYYMTIGINNTLYQSLGIESQECSVRIGFRMN